MAAVEVTIAPAVLEWAIRRTGLSDDDLSAQFPKLDQWVSREAKPTLAQARKLADKAHVPFAFLLLEAPVADNSGVADFRTVRSAAIAELSPELQDVLTAAESRLAWYADHSEASGVEPPAIFASVPGGVSAREAAQETRAVLGLPPEVPLKGSEKVLSLARSMEDAGLLVSRNSIVGNSTKRSLNVEEFRGFTIEDSGFVLVFVNTNDAKTAQLFSLAHELGHVVRGKPGLSDHSDRQKLEQWCNEFAAEFLAPGEAVRHGYKSGEVLDEVDAVSRRFGLSREASLLRLQKLNLITKADAAEAYPVLMAAKPNSAENRGGAPQFPVLVRARVGERFFDTLTQAAVDGQVSDMEAARYLGARSFDKFQNLVAKRRPIGTQGA